MITVHFTKKRASLKPHRTVCMLVLLAFLACDVAVVSPPQPTEADTYLGDFSMVVEPDSAVIDAFQVFKFTAITKHGAGNLDTVAATWTAEGGDISQNGLFTAGQHPGEFAVVATTAGGLAGTAKVVVTKPSVVQIDVDPEVLTLTIGDSARIQATPRDHDGNALRIPVSWKTSDSLVATVDSTGAVIAAAAGTAIINAAAGEMAASVPVSVSEVSVSLVTITPDSARLDVGDTIHLESTALDAEGTVVASTITWVSDAADIAGVDSEGRVVAISPGFALITARVGDASDSAQVEVRYQPPSPTDTYYVDWEGNDSASGTTLVTAWKTLERVNKAQLSPGAKVLLKRGGLWREVLYPRSGVYYGAYGSGPRPAISGAERLTEWRGEGGGVFSASFNWHHAYMGVWTDDGYGFASAPDRGFVFNHPGAFIQEGGRIYVSTLDGSTPQALEVSRRSGIELRGRSDVLITDLEIRHAVTGILIDARSPGADIRNVAVRYAGYYGVESYGTATYIGDSSFEAIGQPRGGGGVTLLGSGQTVESSLFFKNGGHPLLNELGHSESWGGGPQAADGARNCVIQFNTVIGVGGGLRSDMGVNLENDVRGCVVLENEVREVTMGISAWGTGGGNEIVGNTIQNLVDTTAPQHLVVGVFLGGSSPEHRINDNVVVSDRSYSATADFALIYVSAESAPGVSIDSNTYCFPSHRNHIGMWGPEFGYRDFEAWRALSGQDTHSVERASCVEVKT